ncbi:MAG: hypothetical protein HUJ54_07825 [Erysipelotrichaceae bacterium]|nr:hypothetical protein [Erysipelotrichaceae bacterium]
MNQKAVRSKLVYFVWLLSFAGICMISGFLLYIQTVQVSLTSSLLITMEGANGNAGITEIKNPDVENTGQSGFFASVVYQAYPASHLSNGQQITITALSSVDFGRQFRISASGKSVQVTIEGLTDEDKTTEMEVKQ